MMPNTSRKSPRRPHEFPTIKASFVELLLYCVPSLQVTHLARDRLFYLQRCKCHSAVRQIASCKLTV